MFNNFFKPDLLRLGSFCESVSEVLLELSSLSAPLSLSPFCDFEDFEFRLDPLPEEDLSFSTWVSELPLNLSSPAANAFLCSVAGALLFLIPDLFSFAGAGLVSNCCSRSFSFSFFEGGAAAALARPAPPGARSPAFAAFSE